MSSIDKVLARAEGAIAYLLLNKPAKLNALDEGMLLAIEQQFAAWEQDLSIAIVVLGSTSERAFCVGADIEVLSRLNESSMQAWELLGNRVLDRIQSSPLVSVASISGQALGGGLTLAAACDFRICSANATFGQPEIDLGWVPGWGGVIRLSRLAGVGRAKELCMTGRRITAREAEAIGLVNRVVEVDQLAAKTAEFASGLAAKSRDALRGIKALAEPRGSDAAAHLLDALLNSSLLNNERGQAAIAKFLARKKSS
jgi:enoyl-CoA hydratase/carnithine racemase